jgi:hypothetical protein
MPQFRISEHYYEKQYKTKYRLGENKMAKKAKKLCTWKKKDVAADFDRFADIIRNPKFVCKKCGWVSTKKMYLHKPTALK